jgi:hypothetical protein
MDQLALRLSRTLRYDSQSLALNVRQVDLRPLHDTSDAHDDK